MTAKLFQFRLTNDPRCSTSGIWKPIEHKVLQSLSDPLLAREESDLFAIAKVVVLRQYAALALRRLFSDDHRILKVQIPGFRSLSAVGTCSVVYRVGKSP